MLSLSQLNKIIDTPEVVAVAPQDVVIIDNIEPISDRQTVVNEAVRLSKFFKDRTLPDVYVCGIKNLRVFVDATFENMRKYYKDDLYLRDRVMDLKTIYERIHHSIKDNKAV